MFSFTKTGSSVLDLTGVSSFTGPTSVSAGTLLVDGSLTATGARRDGCEQPPRSAAAARSPEAATVQAGGHLTPGDLAVGHLSASNVALQTGADFDVEIAGNSAAAYDQLLASGTVDITNSNLNVSFVGYTPSAGDSYQIVTAGNLIGEFGNVTNPADFPITGAAELAQGSGRLHRHVCHDQHHQQRRAYVALLDRHQRLGLEQQLLGLVPDVRSPPPGFVPSTLSNDLHFDTTVAGFVDSPTNFQP